MSKTGLDVDEVEGSGMKNEEGKSDSDSHGDEGVEKKFPNPNSQDNEPEIPQDESNGKASVEISAAEFEKFKEWKVLGHSTSFLSVDKFGTHWAYSGPFKFNNSAPFDSSGLLENQKEFLTFGFDNQAALDLTVAGTSNLQKLQPNDFTTPEVTEVENISMDENKEDGSNEIECSRGDEVKGVETPSDFPNAHKIPQVEASTNSCNKQQASDASTNYMALEKNSSGDSAAPVLVEQTNSGISNQDNARENIKRSSDDKSNEVCKRKKAISPSEKQGTSCKIEHLQVVSEENKEFRFNPRESSGSTDETDWKQTLEETRGKLKDEINKSNKAYGELKQKLDDSKRKGGELSETLKEAKREIEKLNSKVEAMNHSRRTERKENQTKLGKVEDLLVSQMKGALAIQRYLQAYKTSKLEHRGGKSETVQSSVAKGSSKICLKEDPAPCSSGSAKQRKITLSGVFENALEANQQHGIGNWKCKLCGKVLSERMDYFKLHVLRVHGKEFNGLADYKNCCKYGIALDKKEGK